jgi:nitrogen-specific signal transduction histidine kinase/CheY-like chemotaxis protein
MVRDITARKREEAEREKLEAQYLQAQKMEAVGRLAGGVAHDFNNMLSVILLHTEAALAKLDPADPLYADFEEIQKAGRRSADLTRQLLAFARKQAVAPKVLNLNETVEGMLKMLRRLIGEDISLSWKPGPALRQIHIDPTQIDQMLANLCVNARDAITDIGRIIIETANAVFDEAYCAEHAEYLPGEYVMLAIRDTGYGMDKETLSQIFEPFFTTKETGKGTGLGLATVYGIVKQNNGFITVDSEPGEGTTIKIFLPPYGGAVEQAAPESQAEAINGGPETILLVEDEPAILKLGKTILERLGYTVLTAATPGEAIQLAEERQGRIDLLMTDVVMPEMNGRDLANNLIARYPEIKRLFMSGYTADVIVHHGVLDEGVNFIQKPFSMKDLAAKVRETLSGR